MNAGSLFFFLVSIHSVQSMEHTSSELGLVTRSNATKKRQSSLNGKSQFNMIKSMEQVSFT